VLEELDEEEGEGTHETEQGARQALLYDPADDIED
jgi:hypothetical protein